MRLINIEPFEKEGWLLQRYVPAEYGLAIEFKDTSEIQTIGGWISVKDRLPESMVNKVLVWLEHEDLVGYIGFGHFEKYQGLEMWYDLEHQEQFAKRGYTVTHWMSLPEPPNEGKDNE